MTQIAFVWGSWSVYWSGIILALAVLAASLAALAFRLLQGRDAAGLLLFLPFAMLLSLLLSRLLHFYCFYRQYSGLRQALTDYSCGSFSLPGVFAGVLLAVLLARLLGLTDSAAEFLDALSPAAALGLGAGRLCFFFNSLDRGKMTFRSEALHGLPFSTPLDIVGGCEWRAAVFFWQSLTTFALFLLLTVLFFLRRKDPQRRNGRLFLLFMAIFCAAEILFDSMRYDSAFLRSNGFVSLVQILGIGVLLSELILFACRAAGKNAGKGRIVRGCLLFILGAGLAGVMEYAVQRRGNLYAACYALMALGLCLCCTALLRMEKLSRKSGGECASPDAQRRSAPRGKKA